MTIYDHLGLRFVLKDKISEAGYTQAQFAELAGCSLQNIKNLLHNNNVRLSTLEQFSRLLNCRVSDFFVVEHDILKKDIHDEEETSPEEVPVSVPAPVEKEKREKIVSTFMSNQTGKIYKIVEIES